MAAVLGMGSGFADAPSPLPSPSPSPSQPNQGFKHRFYAASNRACVAELEAEASRDAAAIARAAAEALSVWSAWRLAPSDLPPLPEGESHLVLPERGITLIRPPGSQHGSRIHSGHGAAAAAPSAAEAQLHSLLDSVGVPREVAPALLAAAASTLAATGGNGSRDAGSLEAQAAHLVLETVRSRDRVALDELSRGAKLRMGHRLKLASHVASACTP